MIGYFGTKISDHMLVTKHGYLVCLDVPIARTGFQEYAPSELEMPGDDPIKVYRDASQVFDPKTVASFEGNSVTLQHPPQDLDANNDSAYGKGHIQNVRVGTEPDAEGNRYLIADLHVKEANLISQIQSGAMREVSCGYSYRLEPTKDGSNLQQVDIRGNHLAIVPKGRAGREASIQDHAAPVRTRKVPMSIFKHILGLGLQQYAKDAEPEKIADAMKECAADAEPEKKEEPAQAAEPEKTEDAADPMADIRDALKSIGDRLDKLEKPAEEESADDAEIEPEQEEESNDAEPEQEEEESEQQEAEDEGIVIPTGDRPENPIPGADKKIGDALKVMRKAVAASGDRKAIDAFNSLMPKKTGTMKDGYKEIATRKTADHSVVDGRAAAEDFAAKAKAMHRKKTTK